MTGIATEFVNWQQHLPASDARFNTCSPNLLALAAEMTVEWGFLANGCFAARPIRDGTAPSSHAFGAAYDHRYAHVDSKTGVEIQHPGRERALAEVIPWLIDNSAALHLQAIHDYVGCRIWRAGRTSKVADAHTTWWKAQSPNPGNGMGQSWATYFHLETNLTGWGDGTAIHSRLATPPVQPKPSPVEQAVKATKWPTTQPDLTPEEDDMTAARMYRDVRYKNVFLIGAGPATQLSPAGAASLAESKIPMITDLHDLSIKCYVAQARLEMSDLVNDESFVPQ